MPAERERCAHPGRSVTGPSGLGRGGWQARLANIVNEDFLPSNFAVLLPCLHCKCRPSGLGVGGVRFHPVFRSTCFDLMKTLIPNLDPESCPTLSP
eukprot:4217052-Pyramimonas_sp.AAC.1